MHVHVLAVRSIGAAGGRGLGRGTDTGHMSSWGAAAPAGAAASQSSAAMIRMTASSLVVTGAGCWWVVLLWCRQLGLLLAVGLHAVTYACII